MGRFASSAFGAVVVLTVCGLFAAGPVSAIDHEVRILLDLDNDAATGCTVTTVEGPFDGVDQVLATTVETTSPPPAGTVTDVSVLDCTNPVTDTFGPPVSIDGGGWPVGIDNGVGGRDVVETYFPLISSVVSSPTTVRLGVVVTDELGGEQALLTTDGTRTGDPILLVVQGLGVPDIPTLGEWGLILLALALAGASVLLLGRRGTIALGVVLVTLAAGTAWAAGGLDGLTGDWSAGDQLASGNGIVLFGKPGGGDLCFRVDVDLLFNTSPTADPQAVSTDEETPVAIVLTGSDPESDPLTFSIVTGPANGSLSGAPPNVTYTPDADYNGPDSFDFQVEDTSGATDTATVSITVDPVNDPPVAQDDAFTTDEDTQLVGDVLADNGSGADSDVDGDTLSVNATPVSAPTDGTLVLNADGTFTYDPDPGFHGADSFEYEVSDGNGGTDVGLVTITVASVNDPPVAQDDAFSTDEDVQLSGGNVLADNGSGADSDDDGDPLTVDTTPVSAPTNGTLVLNADGTFTYDPNPDFNGADSFEYQVSDGNGGTDVGLVSITINPINDDPTAVDDNFLVSEDSLNNALDVLANDDDAPDTGETLTITGVGAPDQGGSVAVNGTNDGLVYSPAPNFVGNETFTYDIADGNGGTATATVTVAVSAVNDAPVVDLDADDSGGTVGTGYAVAYAENDGAVAAVDATDATITDVDSSDLESVTITLQNLLDAGEELLAATSSDPDITVESYDTTTVPGEGILRLTTTSPQPIADFVTVLRTVTYEHTGDDPDTSNPRTIAFVADDGIDAGPAAISTVTITAANDPPVAQDDAYTTPEDTQLVAGSVLDDNGSGPDTDPEGDSLTVNTTPVSGPTDGTLVLNADGTFTYDPDPDFNGSDSFVYEVSDGNGGTDTATVSITVTAVNDPPVAQDDAFTTDEDVQLAGNVLVDNGSGIDDDADGDTLTVNTTPVTAPTDGTLVLNADGSFTYDPDPNFNGSDSFVYEVSDGNGGTDTATVSITVTAVNDPPVAQDDAFTTDEDVQLAGNVLVDNGSGIDDDSDGDTLTVNTTPVTAPTDGTLVLNADGSFTYDPDPDFNGSDSFVYEVSDGNGGTDTATVSITVTAVNDPPVAQDDAYTTPEDTQLLAGSVLADNGSGADTDVDGDTLTVNTTPVSGPSNGTLALAADGTFTYDPDPNFNGSDSFTYEVSDGNGGTDTAVVSITVTAVDDPPVAVADAAMVNEDSGANAIDVLMNDTDIDGGPKTVQMVTPPTNGTVMITGGGTGLTYAPNLNYCNDGTPTDDFTYTLNGGSSTTVSVTVVCINDPPVAGNDTFDFIGNTELRVDLAAAATPHALETTGSGFGLLDNDSDPVENDPISIVSITGCADGTAPFDCTIAGVGTVHVESNGRFSFVPLPGDTDASEVFTYTLSDGTDTVNATVTLNRSERVWYVRNDTGTPGTAGTSVDPFDTLVEAQTASLANDYIFVYFGNGTSSGQNAGISLKSGQHLLGEHVGLSIPVNLNGNGSPTVLFTAVPGNRPLLGDAAAGGPEGVSAVDVIPAEVAGLSLSGNVNAIEWTTTGGFAGGGTLFEIRDNVVTGAGAIGVDVNLAGTGATRLSFHDNAITATGTGLNVQETGSGALTITAFDDNSVSGATGGSGMVVSNAIFDAVPGGGFDLVAGGTTAIGSPGNRVGGAGLTMGGVSGDLMFTDLDVFADAGAGLSVTGTGPSNLAGGTGLRFRVGAGVGMAVATGGPAVSLTNLTADLQLSSLTSTGSATTGVSLTGVTDGGGIDAVFTAGAGSSITLAGGTSAAFLVSGGNARIAYGGTIVNNASGANAVSISTWAGDDASDDLVLSGSIDENGAGIRVQNNAGSRAITFSGGLDIDTTGSTAEGFVATSNTNTLGVHVTGSTNDIDSVSATALRVTNTTIGSSHLNFRRVSSGNNTGAADPTNGIVLTNTGSSGSLKITGTGGAGTGGTIQSTSGHAIELTNTLHPQLAWMNLQNIGRNGIDGQQVTNFTFSNSTINNVGTAAAGQYDESNIAFNDGGAFTASSLSGTVSITNNTLTNARRHGIQIENGTGTIANLTISNNTLTSATSAAQSLGSGILILTQGSAATTSHLTTGSISNNTISRFPSGAGILVGGGSGNSTNNTSATLGANGTPIDITGNFIAGQSAGSRMGTNAIQVSFNGQNGVSNFNISGNGTVANPLRNYAGIGITVFMGGSVTGSTTVNNNVLTSNNTAASSGIAVQADDGPAGAGTSAANVNFTINGNNVSANEGFGIRAIARASLAVMDLTIQDNTVAAPIVANRNGIRVDSGSAAGDVTLCMAMSGNTSAGSGVNQGIGLRKQGNVATTNDFGIVGLAPSPTTGANAAAKVAADNPAGGGVDIINGDNFVSCTITP